MANIESMPDGPSEIAKDLGHEPLAISARSVVIGMIALSLTVIAALLLMGGLMLYLARAFERAATVGPGGEPLAPPPGVAELQVDQSATLHELRDRENRRLQEYTWIDREEGVARIPIRRAMQILAEQQTSQPAAPSGEDESSAQ
jgi:hypothetical protein